MFRKIRIVILVLCLGFLSGLGAHYLLNQETGMLVNRPLRINIPESGIKTDTFGISLLHAAMKRDPGASVLVAPALTGEALMLLKEHASESILRDIDKMGIIFPDTEHTSIPLSNVVTAADHGLSYDESYDSSSIMRLPFCANRPLAMTIFNGELGSEIRETAEPLIGSKLLAGNTKFLIGTIAHMEPKFETPFLTQNSLAAEFENANGSIPNVSMMRLRAHVRYVKDDMGDWEAVALLLKPDYDRHAEPTAWIGILPASSAEAMAKQLTAEQLTAIRQKLAQATPVDCCVCLPQLFWAPPARDLKPLMEDMGLNQLFDSSAPNWKFTKEKLGLDAFPEKISISLTPQQGNIKAQPRPENAAESISFNRPFIWLISDLTGATPPYFIGLVQNL